MIEGLVHKIKEKLEAELANNGDPDEYAKKIATTAFEIHVHGKNYGRIHEIVWNKTLYVIWFDPAHNLYPRKGERPKLHRDYATVSGFSPRKVQTLQKENRKLHDEHNALRREHEELLTLYANS